MKRRYQLGIGGAVVGTIATLGLMHSASATNLNVTYESTCPNGLWTITINLHNEYTEPLPVSLDNSVENYQTTVAPGQTKSPHFIEDGDTFHWVATSTTAHLFGDVQGTIQRPAHCGTLDIIPSTTVQPITTTEATTTTSAPPPSDTPAPTTSTSIAVTVGPPPTTQGAAPTPAPHRPPQQTTTSVKLALPATE